MQSLLKGFLLPLALLGFFNAFSRTFAEDWPQWLGPKRDGASTETIKPWKGELKVLWRKPVGPGHSSPVVANGVLYVTAGNTLFAIREKK